MKGFIYIASAFHTVNRSKCGQGGTWIDNDPHFWNDPPTWGICRSDLRAKCEPGDYVFFVLPLHGRHPQMIFAYMRIERIVTHFEAYGEPTLIRKRMGNKNPNGNIIVDANGDYNRFDSGAHKYKFDRIKPHYAIGESRNSLMLTPNQIQSLAPEFLEKLATILGWPSRTSPTKAFDVITRAGQTLNAAQIRSLVSWLNSAV